MKKEINDRIDSLQKEVKKVKIASQSNAQPAIPTGLMRAISGNGNDGLMRAISGNADDIKGLADQSAKDSELRSDIDKLNK